MTELPAPLISAEVALRDFDYMPLHGKRLFSSETWILCSAEEKVAALSLWWASWHEEPAGSLPDNDRLLAVLAGYGVAVDAFKKVKDNAMRGWIKCNDGRLYHPIVCEIAEESWSGKKKKSAENARERERKRQKKEARLAEERARLAGLSAETATATSGNTENSAGNNENSAGASRGIPPENALKGREEGREEIIPPVGPPLRESLIAPPDGVAQPIDLLGEQPKARGGRERGTKLPADWHPGAELMELARGWGLDPDWELQKFRDHWHAQSGAKACKSDWAATWRNWCRKSLEMRSGRKAVNPQSNQSYIDGLKEKYRDD